VQWFSSPFPFLSNKKDAFLYDNTPAAVPDSSLADINSIITYFLEKQQPL
jgi:hypothetical protein